MDTHPPYNPEFVTQVPPLKQSAFQPVADYDTADQHSYEMQHDVSAAVAPVPKPDQLRVVLPVSLPVVEHEHLVESPPPYEIAAQATTEPHNQQFSQSPPEMANPPETVSYYSGAPMQGQHSYYPNAQSYPILQHHAIPGEQQQQSVVVINHNIPVVPQPVSQQSFCGHIALACFVLWCCGVLFGLIAFILAGKSSFLSRCACIASIIPLYRTHWALLIYLLYLRSVVDSMSILKFNCTV